MGHHTRACKITAPDPPLRSSMLAAEHFADAVGHTPPRSTPQTSISLTPMARPVTLTCCGGGMR